MRRSRPLHRRGRGEGAERAESPGSLRVLRAFSASSAVESGFARGRRLLAIVIVYLFLPLAAFAQPKFPVLTGRVVDQAQMLSPETERRLNDQLADLETKTGRQLVVATVPDLQGYEIEDYGYQL